ILDYRWAASPTSDDPFEEVQPPVFQDDEAVIGNATNGFGFRANPHSTIATAQVLTSTTTLYTAAGVIVHPTDADYFQFEAAGTGPTTIQVMIDPYVNDLTPKVSLYNLSGTLIASSNPNTNTSIQLVQSLAPGKYYVAVGSHGSAGETGQYSLSITIPAPVPPPPPPPPP